MAFLAHIEFVAIDLALDMAGRFGAEMGRGFVTDFLAVAADEAMHFALIERKLRALGTIYGALPAHAGLWQAAHDTRHDVGRAARRGADGAGGARARRDAGACSSGCVPQGDESGRANPRTNP